MENQFLDGETAAEIDQSVAKILAGLGHPAPPLRLEEVRELLHLDRVYYSSTDQGMLQETVHRLKVAGKQVMKRPSLLLDAIKKFDLSALWLPDRKRILLDSRMPKLKQRWGEAHEVGHSIIPWHEPLMHGDQHRTLSFDCHQRIEKEANYAAGRLLFLQDHFGEEVRSGPVDFRRVQTLHKTYGNTMTATLWRTVESLAIPAMGLVSIHPQEDPEDNHSPIRYFLRSATFAKQFAAISAEQVFHTLRDFCYGRRGPIGTGEIILEDICGVGHVFLFESFHNSYDALTLGIYQRKRNMSC
jgi:hypothetical protein